MRATCISDVVYQVNVRTNQISSSIKMIWFNQSYVVLSHSFSDSFNDSYEIEGERVCIYHKLPSPISL